MQLMAVVLPEPFGPSKPKTSPSFTCKLKWQLSLPAAPKALLDKDKHDRVDGEGGKALCAIWPVFCPFLTLLYYEVFPPLVWWVLEVSGAIVIILLGLSRTQSLSNSDFASGGSLFFGDKIMLKLPNLLHSREPQDLAAHGISDKEAAIVKLVARGLSNREIADTLYLSEGTVRNYISVILEKLQLRDRTQLAVFYLSRLGQGD